jgi:hypothetical protein
MNVTKGTRVRAQWFEATGASLAGMQMKVGASSREVVGVVRHIYGKTPDDPDPTLYLDPETLWDGPTANDCSCGGPHVRVQGRHVVEVLTSGSP